MLHPHKKSLFLSVLDKEKQLGTAAHHHFVFSVQSKQLMRDECAASAVLLNNSSSVCQYVWRHLPVESMRSKKRSADLTDGHYHVYCLSVKTINSLIVGPDQSYCFFPSNHYFRRVWEEQLLFIGLLGAIFCVLFNTLPAPPRPAPHRHHHHCWLPKIILNLISSTYFTACLKCMLVLEAFLCHM